VREYQTTLERSRESLAGRRRASTFVLHGREWDLLPDVYAPDHSPSTEIALELLGKATQRRPPAALLEMGCGTGVIAVTAALHGSTRVVGVDINAAAVRNTRLNAVRHGVDDRVHVVQSDLFDELPPVEKGEKNKKFDVIFWSSPSVLAPMDYEYRHVHERAYVDAGYATHQRFLADAPRWLNPGGSVLLHFSTRGNLVALLRAADTHHRGLHIVRSVVRREADHTIDHMLIEITTPR
jgi:release factor glutamine methyltransferase